MPLNDMQIRCAKPEVKAYTLSDGLGLSLLVEPNGSKNWRFRYSFGGKPKMMSLRVHPTILAGIMRATAGFSEQRYRQATSGKSIDYQAMA